MLVGSVVEVVGLQARSDLNGLAAVVVRHEESGRIQCELERLQLTD